VLDTILVDTVSEIHNAFDEAQAGDKIVISAGTYTGSDDDSGSSKGYFYLSASGTQENPIWIVAQDLENMPVLQGDDNTTDYVLYITGDYVAVEGVIFKTANQGIVLDNSNYSVLDNVEVYDIGQEAIHIRDGSSYTIVQNSFVHTTGLNVNKYGEGIYVGSDYTKWPENGGNYIKECDYVQIINNTIGPDVSAEHIDIKEGSSYTTVSGNTFNGVGIDDTENGGTSFMDLKGNYAQVMYNLGNQNGNELIEHAFEVNTKSEGWGSYNIFHNNTTNFDDDNYQSLIVEWNKSSSYTSPVGTESYDNIRNPEDAALIDNIP